MAKTNLGKILITPKGDYAADMQYAVLDVVSYLGSGYICIKLPAVGNLPTDTEFWMKIVSKGDKGDTGNAATITVGTVTTGAAGSAVQVTNVGNQYDAVLNFVIPAGDPVAIHSATEKTTTLVDDDEFAVWDSVAAAFRRFKSSRLAIWIKAVLDTWVIKRTKMPDGATAVYSQDAWATVDGWSTGMSFSAPSSGIARFTYGITDYIYKNITGILGKTLLIRWRTDGIKSLRIAASSGGAVTLATYNPSSAWQIATVSIPAYLAAEQLIFNLVSAGSGNWFEIDVIWIGDYSYLAGSFSEEAARVFSEAADAPGVPVAASGTITSSGTNVTAGDTVTIAGKTYTFVNSISATRVEGEIKIAGTYGSTLEYLSLAIKRSSPASFDYNGSSPIYNVASAHPLVTASVPAAPYNPVTITALTTGELGNSITLAKSAATLTLSGSTLTGGCSAGAAKMSYLVARGSQGLDAKTSLVAGDYLTLLDSVVGFLKKKILVSNFFAINGGTGAYTAVQGNDSRLQGAPTTWTSVPKFGGVTDDGSYSLSFNSYTQSGKKVHLETFFTWTGKGSKIGPVTITGVPVAAPIGNGRIVGVATISIGGVSIAGTIIVLIAESTLSLYMQSATGITALTDANFSSTTQLRIVADYIAA